MTDCICRFQGRALDRPQTDASPDGSVASGRDLVRVPNTEAIKAAFVKSAAGIKTAENPQKSNDRLQQGLLWMPRCVQRRNGSAGFSGSIIPQWEICTRAARGVYLRMRGLCGLDKDPGYLWHTLESFC